MGTGRANSRPGKDRAGRPAALLTMWRSSCRKFSSPRQGSGLWPISQYLSGEIVGSIYSLINCYVGNRSEPEMNPLSSKF